MKLYCIEEGIILGPREIIPWDLVHSILVVINVNTKGLERGKANAIAYNNQNLINAAYPKALEELAQFLGVKSDGRTVNQIRTSIRNKIDVLRRKVSPATPLV